MFKKSLMMVLMVFTVVFASAFTSQIIALQGLPSAYDPGLKIDEAFQTSRVPIFIEFYSDTCTTCRRMAPMVHDLMKSYDKRVTLVMMDIDEPDNAAIAKLFGVDELPGLFVFDAGRMKKHQITSEHFLTRKTIQAELDQILEKIASSKAPVKNTQAPQAI